MLGALSAARAADHPLAAIIAQEFGATKVTPGRVHVDLPKIAENGNVVPLTVSVESPMSASDFVATIVVFSEKNPLPIIAKMQLGPRSGKAQVATRIRLAATQRIVVVAKMSDASLWSGEAEVVVASAACGD